MKSLVFNLKTLAVAGAATLVAACSDYAPDEFNGNLSQKDYEAIIEYTKNFEDSYGKIDPKQDWGFGSLNPNDGNAGRRSVRVTRGSSSPNNNIGAASYGYIWDSSTNSSTLGITYEKNWVNVIKDVTNGSNGSNGSNVIGYHTKRLTRGGNPYFIKVPGFPSDVDKKYHVENFNNFSGTIQYDKDLKETVVYTKDQVDNGEILEETGNLKGDVTNEEIVFVSKWFREHQNPQKMSKDLLNKSYADDIIEKLEVEYVPNLHLNTFFIQNISCDADRNLDDNGFANGAPKDGNSSYGMDYLCGVTAADSNGDADSLHMGDFNIGNLQYNRIDKTIFPDLWFESHPYRGIMLFEGAENEWITGFSYRNTQQNANRTDNVIMHIKFKFTQAYGGLEYDGYYLGIDYQYEKGDDKWDADGFYSNWIVKISDALPDYKPGKEVQHSAEARVMCEDLGNTYDIDFNDLVFDVKYEWVEKDGQIVPRTDGKKYTATITLQAIGGTLPIWLNEVENGKELHSVMMGSSNNGLEPINAIEGGLERKAMTLPKFGTDSADPNDIKIYIQRKGYEKGETVSADNVTILPNSEIGKAPLKICIPGETSTSVKWMKENATIQFGYYFEKYVQGTNPDFWSSIKNDSYLYHHSSSYE